MNERHPRGGATYIKDVIYAASDGIITMFALVAGATGASLQSYVILILGIATLLADGVSMGVSDYLGTKSEMALNARQREMENREIDEVPEVEKEEVRKIFLDRGLSKEETEKVTEIVTSDKRLWLDLMMSFELGLEKKGDGEQYKAAGLSFVAFIAAGFMPLVFYFFSEKVGLSNTMLLSAATAFISLFVVGAVRVLVTGRNWIASGFELMVVGGGAALVAYLLGSFLRGIVVIA